MATRTIIYNLEHCIPNAMFCSSLGGEYSVMSMPVTRAEEKNLYKEYGIDFYFPLVELKISKPEERKLLKANGFWLGYRLRRGHHGVQPICIPGLHHIGDVLFDLHTSYNPENVQGFITDKKVIIKSVIEDYFKEKDMNIQNLVDAIKLKKKE